MVPSRRLVTLLTALALAVSPASAFGQGAGDDQYEDPFGDEVPQTASPTPAPSGSGSQDEGEESAPPLTGEMPGGEDEAADDQTPAPSAPPVARTQLPATGSEALLVGMLGAAFVAGGAGLRLRLRDGAPAA